MHLIFERYPSLVVSYKLRLGDKQTWGNVVGRLEFVYWGESL